MGRATVNLPDEYLARLISDVVRAVPTERLFIFGSYARGTQKPESDLDIFVVTSNDDERPAEYGKRARLALPWINAWSKDGLPKGKDVVCAPSRLFEKRSKELSSLEYVVAHEGVKIYG